jgi:hypothetical protein
MQYINQTITLLHRPRSASAAPPSAASRPISSVPRLSFKLLPSLASTSLARPGAGLCPVGPTLSASPFIAAIVGSVVVVAFSAGSTAAATFSARSVVPLARSPSLWLDPSLSWLSRSNPPIPLLLYCGRGHPDRRRCTRCRRPPWRGSSTTGCQKKQEGPRSTATLLLLRRPADR